MLQPTRHEPTHSRASPTGLTSIMLCVGSFFDGGQPMEIELRRDYRERYLEVERLHSEPPPPSRLRIRSRTISRVRTPDGCIPSGGGFRRLLVAGNASQ